MFIIDELSLVLIITPTFRPKAVQTPQVVNSSFLADGESVQVTMNGLLADGRRHWITQTTHSV